MLVKCSSQRKIQKIWLPKNDFESTNFANFEDVVHNFGRSDYDMI